MRKLLIAITALLLLLSGCGKKEEAYSVELVGQMVQSEVFSEELEELDGDIAFSLYGLADQGLAREDLTACAVQRSAGATCEEGAVLVFSSDEQARKALTALQDYVQSQIEANEDYRPGEIPKLENALVSQQGSTVLLVVANDLDAANALLK